MPDDIATRAKARISADERAECYGVSLPPETDLLRELVAKVESLEAEVERLQAVVAETARAPQDLRVYGAHPGGAR